MHPQISPGERSERDNGAGSTVVFVHVQASRILAVQLHSLHRSVLQMKRDFGTVLHTIVITSTLMFRQLELTNSELCRIQIRC